jgi:cytochrome c
VKTALCLIATVMLCAAGAHAQKPQPPRATPAEARAFLDKAVAHYQKVGRAQALKDFNAAKGAFVDRDLYVFCAGPDNKMVAHGADQAQIGVDITTRKDVDGKAFGAEVVRVAGQPGGGSVEYKWMNPVTKQVEAKVSYVRKVGPDICGVGAYK